MPVGTRGRNVHVGARVALRAPADICQQARLSPHEALQLLAGGP